MKNKKIMALLIGAAMCLQSAAVFADVEPVGTDLNFKPYAESAAETQKLIDNRPDIQRQMEELDRGTVAVSVEGYVFVSWRWLGTESADVKYNVYRDGELLNPAPLNVTNYTDIAPKKGAKYTIGAVDASGSETKSAPVEVWDNAYIDVPIEIPAENEIKGEKYTYKAGDASVGDLDGDGQYEIVLKWDPSNAKDAAQAGYTGECLIDAYEMSGKKLWRINLGKNIRSGAHDTQFMVADYDGDGKAEVAMRTADGTTAGDGTVIGDGSKDWADENGKT